MDEEINKKLDNTLKVIEKVLEKHTDNSNVKDIYQEVLKIENASKNQNTTQK